MKKHSVSFRNAWAGIVYVLKTQPNFRIHLSFTTLAVFLGFFFRISLLEWTILTFTVAFVLVAEMVNTAAESMVDLVTERWHQRAKIVKDVAAGVVLVAATVSVIIGLILFGPYVSNLFL